MMETANLKKCVSIIYARTLVLCMEPVDVMQFARPSTMTESVLVHLDILAIHIHYVLELLYYLNVHLTEIVHLVKYAKINDVSLVVVQMLTVRMTRPACMDVVNEYANLVELVDKMLTAPLLHINLIAVVQLI